MNPSELKPLLSSIFTNVDRDLEDMGILKRIEKLTGIRPSQSFLLICFIVLFLALFDILAALLTTLFGMLYPAYMSWKAIEKNNQEQKKIWLTYWIVFGFLTSIDGTFSFVLAYVPGFYAIRFVAYVWMFYPREKNGATVIYTALKPILQKFNSKVEEINSRVGKKVE